MDTTSPQLLFATYCLFTVGQENWIWIGNEFIWIFGIAAWRETLCLSVSMNQCFLSSLVSRFLSSMQTSNPLTQLLFCGICWMYLHTCFVDSTTPPCYKANPGWTPLPATLLKPPEQWFYYPLPLTFTGPSSQSHSWKRVKKNCFWWNFIHSCVLFTTLAGLFENLFFVYKAQLETGLKHIFEGFLKSILFVMFFYNMSQVCIESSGEIGMLWCTRTIPFLPLNHMFLDPSQFSTTYNIEWVCTAQQVQEAIGSPFDISDLAHWEKVLQHFHPM